MWETISNVSGLITCILFIAYIIGHIWTIYIAKHEFDVFIDCHKEECLEVLKDIKYVDFGGDESVIFSFYSSRGIKKVRVFCANKGDTSKGKLIKELRYIKSDGKVYFKGDSLWRTSNVFVELETTDYIKISFKMAENEEEDDGSYYFDDYKSQMTLKSWLYYLCK